MFMKTPDEYKQSLNSLYIKFDMILHEMSKSYPNLDFHNISTFLDIYYIVM